MKPTFEEWSENDDDPEREPFRTRIFRKNIGIIDMQYSDDDVMMFCPYCKEAGFKVKLQARILMDGEVRQPDYENWLSCPDCYRVVAAYVVEGDSSIIKDDIETVETPFDNTTEIVGASPRRNTPRGKRAMNKRRRERDRPHHKDKDIDLEMQEHGDRVNVLK